MIKSRFKEIKWVFLLACVLCLFACRHQDESRSVGERRLLTSIDDSMEVQSPMVRKMIGQAMDMATDSLFYYEAYARMAKYYLVSVHPDSLFPILDKTMRFAVRQPSSPRNNSLLAYLYGTRAIYYHNHRLNPDTVISLYKQAYEVLHQSDSKDQLPKLCANLGDAYIFKSQLPEAASWYRKALFLVDSLRLPPKENITLYMGLATIYLQLNDFTSSLKYFQQTEKYFSQMSVPMRAYYLNNFGTYYYYTKDYKASLGKFLALKAFLEKYGKLDTFDMYLCKLNLSDVYLNLGDVAMSEKYLDEVEPIIVRSGDGVAAYYVNTIRIGQAVKKGNMAEVEHILAKEGKVDNLEFSMRQIRNLYLRKYAEAIGDYKGAYENLREDMQKNDSLEHNRTNMRASEIMERFSQDTLQLHHRIMMEHKNADLQKAYAVIFAAVGAVLVIALLLAFWVMRSRKRYEEDKMRIMQLRLDRARNRISPHFVFNVLNNKIIHSDEQEANELLGLAKLIRANLDLSCQLSVTLQEELDFVERYVKVEQYTVGEDFEFRIDVDADVDVKKVRIPSMFVQILVENAFVHGLKGWEGHKSIHIEITHKSEATYVSVCDNGPGFDIRSTGKKRTGLSIISQTIAIINERNKSKMKFSLHNVQDKNGKVVGCMSTIVIPDKIKQIF